jgi:hypothetical protein
MTGRSGPVLHYTVDEKGTFDAGLEWSGLDPGTLVELRVDAHLVSAVQLPKTAASADDNGGVKLALRITGSGSLETNADFVSCVKKPGQGVRVEKERLPVRR